MLKWLVTCFRKRKMPSLNTAGSSIETTRGFEIFSKRNCAGLLRKEMYESAYADDWVKEMIGESAQSICLGQRVGAK
jgi:hypothetical protein